MEKILVTGGAGYLGSKLSIYLEGKGYDVEIYDKPRDISDKESLARALSDKDIVFHLAALANLSYVDSHPTETFITNIEGTENLCEICSKRKIFLNFISTCSIYGDCEKEAAREGSMISPKDAYACSKVAGEYIVLMWHFSQGLKFNILRIGTVYGRSMKKEMREDMAVQNFLTKAVFEQKIEVQGDGTQTRNFINLDDLISGFYQVLKNNVSGEVVNLCGKESIPIKSIAEFALSKGALSIDYRPERKNDVKKQNVSIEKAKSILRWEPKIDFHNGIVDFYRWLKTK